MLESVSPLYLLLILTTVAVVVIAVWFFLKSKKNRNKPEINLSSPDSASVEAPVEAPKPIEVVKTKSWAERLNLGLSKSREGIWGKIESIFRSDESFQDQLEEIEALLFASDLGPAPVAELIDKLKNELKSSGTYSTPDLVAVKKILFDFLWNKMASVQDKVDPELFNSSSAGHSPSSTPKVIMVVGVNGAGKTTTIGKLAMKFASQGSKVVVGAADTFRAAAVDQLAVWCERAGVKMIRAKEGGDPSGVVYDTLLSAQKEQADYCIIDTAGRLHTNNNLMDELKKSKRVLSKLDPSAPHHTLLVIDAITGQNAIKQAKEFNSTLQLTGLIFTKCDGSSKAGSAVAIVNELQLPIVYIGVGEAVEDLDKFDLKQYLSSLLDFNID